MKILTLVKIFGCGVIIAGGVTAAVEFSNVNTKRFPTVRILTKEFYNQIKQDQGVSAASAINQGAYIDYYSLPGTDYTTLNVAQGQGINQNYMFFFGSEAYPETTKALYGWDGAFASSQGSPIMYSNSLMLNLYDLFLTDNQQAVDFGVDKVNPIFLNYIDVCSTKEINDNENLFYDRFSKMGDRNYNDSPTPDPDHSREWIVNQEDIADTSYVPVVKGATKFNYAPENNSYEFRPNNGVDTQYETVYFRNQNIVKSWNDIGNFFAKYLNEKYGLSFSKNGTLLCVKYADNQWSFKTLTSFTDDVQSQIIDIVKFYNPDYKDNSDNSNGSETPPADSGDTNTSTPPATSRMVNNQVINDSVDNKKIVKKLEY